MGQHFSNKKNIAFFTLVSGVRTDFATIFKYACSKLLQNVKLFSSQCLILLK